MAEAYGKLTGQPGICIVTRGPGATNAALGVHTAFQDSTPMIVFIGQVGRDFVEREAFQEIDYRRMFGQIAKWVAQIDDAERIPEFVARAFQSRWPGGRARWCSRCRRTCCPNAAAQPRCARTAAGQTVAGAGRRWRSSASCSAPRSAPCVILGGSGWDQEAWTPGCSASPRRNDLPCRPRVPRPGPASTTGTAAYAGDVGIGINPKLAAAREEADVLLVDRRAPGRNDDQRATRCSTCPVPRQTLVHVHAGAEELGRVYQPDARDQRRHRAVSPRCSAALGVDASATWSRWSEKRAAPTTRPGSEPRADPGRLQIGGDHPLADRRAARRRHHHQRRRQLRGLAAPLLPLPRLRHAARADQRLDGLRRSGRGRRQAAPPRTRTVVCFAGDGDFLMTGQELATAVQYGAPIIVLVVNNGMYGTIRMHQEREFPGRVSGPTCGIPTSPPSRGPTAPTPTTWSAPKTSPPAFGRAVDSGQPALLHLKLDPEAITPSQSLTQIRESALTRG